MGYQRLKGVEFFKEMDSEEKARAWVWEARYGEQGAYSAESFHSFRLNPSSHSVFRFPLIPE